MSTMKTGLMYYDVWVWEGMPHVFESKMHDTYAPNIPLAAVMVGRLSFLIGPEGIETHYKPFDKPYTYAEFLQRQLTRWNENLNHS